MGLALCVRLREKSVREFESQPEGVKKGKPGPTLGVRFSEVSFGSNNDGDVYENVS